MSLGGGGFVVFNKHLDADVEARLNGEFLWGRQFAYPYGKRSFRFPFLFSRQAHPQLADPATI